MSAWIFIFSIPSARNFVVVNDPLPGGLETVNRDLKTASSVDDAAAVYDQEGGSLWFKYNDWREFNASGGDAAGHVIAGFASFIMGGDFLLIGVIVFLILITVNFLVITKGATRIAEVGARFSLDAMPGKQMAIDADLSAGLIDEQEARRRRREVEDESAFYGAMDGASKFVRGDAIAGLIITAINIGGGIVIGVVRHGLPIDRSLDVFLRLSIGDGLVTQIPALIISLAAGLIVSKGGTRESADKAVFGQIGSQPRAIMIAGLVVAALGLAPGLPMLPFVLLSGALVALARSSRVAMRKRRI